MNEDDERRPDAGAPHDLERNGDEPGDGERPAPLPPPIWSTEPSGQIPCSAQGSATERVKARHGALRQKA